MLDNLSDHPIDVLAVDDSTELFWNEESGNPKLVNRVEDLAYVIYTSGSTGQPKGVQITHRNVVRLFKSTQEWFHFDQTDVWSLFHSHAFDFSVWEILGALLHGGRLVIVPYNTSRSSKEFYKLLVGEKITVLNQTPSAFVQLSAFEEDMEDPEELELRLVIFGGEKLDFQMLADWFEYGLRF